MVPIEVFDPEEILKTVESEKCTVLQGVPTMFISELNHPNFESSDFDMKFKIENSCEIFIQNFSKRCFPLISFIQ